VSSCSFFASIARVCSWFSLSSVCAGSEPASSLVSGKRSQISLASSKVPEFFNPSKSGLGFPCAS